MRQISVGQLFDALKDRLELTWVCGNPDTPVRASGDSSAPSEVVGHLNPIHPDRMQVVGAREIRWAREHNPSDVRQNLMMILAATPPAIIVADSEEIPRMIRHVSESRNIPVLRTPRSAAMVIDQIRSYLSRQLAETVSLHGVFMDVLGIGVMVTGDSGVGKSELALELISRGHGLVADDIVEMSRIAPNVIEGRSPELLKDFLEVRGLGVLNIRTVFGEAACRRCMKLRLVVHLAKPVPGVPEATRLPLDNENTDIIGVKIRKVVIPVAAGRNLAVLVEAAVRSTILQFRGIDSTLEFVDRQRKMLESDDN